MTDQTTQYPAPPAYPPVRPRRNRTGMKLVAGAALFFIAGLATGLSEHTTPAASTSTRTVQVPGPTTTVTTGPPAPTAGSVLGRWTGSGNQSTPSFAAPASGDYIVYWRYWGNTSGYGGDNFIISDTEGGANSFGLPNDIAVSGRGSTEVTGASGTESFNVQATGSWVIKVVEAP